VILPRLHAEITVGTETLMPERVKISANSWAEQKRVVIISSDTSFNVLG
jgi:hypothetical protein